LGSPGAIDEVRYGRANQGKTIMPRRRKLEVRLSQIGALFATLVTTLVTLGIGCSDKEGKPSGATPNPSTTGDIIPDAGADWSDASLPEDLSETQACTRYMRAVCERKNECGLAADDCGKSVAGCPDSLFSPGSTREATSAYQCAFEMRRRSCTDVYLSTNPACVTTGTKKAGESCIAAAQCESLACTGSTTNCGVCLPRVAKGQDCTERTKVVCERGLTCDSSTNTCVDLPPKAFDGVTSTGLEIGKSCDARDLCAPGAYCVYTDGAGSGICTARIAEDGTCTDSASCIETAYCAQETGKCRPIPGVGTRCGNDIETGDPIYCAGNAYCEESNYLCTPLPTAGDACAAARLTGLGNFNLCDPSARCDSSATPPVCVALAGPADSCIDDATCNTGLRCLCSESTCAKKVCGVLRDVGESCAVPGEICNSVTTCSDGRCQANPSQNLFRDLCGQ
jgi:hypothetical protein